jgi:uncharacterized membrane protein
MNSPIVIRSVDPGLCAGWWSAAWALFLRSAARWIALGLVAMLGFGLLGSVPWVGALLAALLSPVALGAWVLAAHRVHGGATLAVRPVLAGLRGRPLRALLTLGAWLAGATLLMMWVSAALGLEAMRGALVLDAPHDARAQAALGTGMLALLLLLAFSLLLMAALWFAPALVLLRGASPAQAVLASLRAVRDNGLTFLLYAMVQLLLAALASLPPYQTGWLVMVPVMLLTIYVSYRDVFEG